MLKTENPANAEKAIAAFFRQRRDARKNPRSLAAHLGKHEPHPGRQSEYAVCFEHGQLWVTRLTTGTIWSVVDAEGYGSVSGFDFELTAGPENS